ncbi:hypothetical protein EQV77_06250 [Halobacillus fulvus]|nr:hypothetical protein EQV77_06250 [Halobacillus fulvus]
MSEEMKQHHFYLTIGYIAMLLLLVTAFRFLYIDDRWGFILAIFGLYSMRSCINYMESKLLPDTKEKRTIKKFFLILYVVVSLGAGYYLLF